MNLDNLDNPDNMGSMEPGENTFQFEAEQQYQCAACGEINDIFVDIAEGYSQSFVEECYACDKPNQITVSIDSETGQVSIGSDLVA